MVQSGFEMPRKFTFDEYYKLLKEYVTHPEARKTLATYDAEYAAGRGYDHAEFSKKAHKALGDLLIVGANILAKNGWPTYKEAIELRDIENLKNIDKTYHEFRRIARRIIRVEVGSPLPDVEVDIQNRESVLHFIKLLSKEMKFWAFELPEDK